MKSYTITLTDKKSKVVLFIKTVLACDKHEAWGKVRHRIALVQMETGYNSYIEIKEG